METFQVIFSILLQERLQGEQSTSAGKADSNVDADFLNVHVSSSALPRNGSDFRIKGELQNPQEVIRRSADFETVIEVLEQLKYDEDFRPESALSEQQREKIEQRDNEIKELFEKMSQMTEENAHNYLEHECYDLLRDIGPPWNWLHNFASQTCREKSYNFLESIASDATPAADVQSSDESFDYLNEKFFPGKGSVVTAGDDAKSSISGASGVSLSRHNVDEPDDTASNNHKVLIETVCSISEAADKGDCNIRDTASVASFLQSQNSSEQLADGDYERLKGFIDQAAEKGIVFNDLNELYNYFIQESSRERSTHGVEIREEDNDEADFENVIMPSDKTEAEADEKCEKAEGMNVVAIFGESGIEVDNKLLDAKVSESMILGLVDRPQFEDNVSDVASSVSSLSHAETVKMRQNVTREKDTQTSTYKEQIHSKRMHSKQGGKSKSASSVKRQPFTCKIPPIPGIGPSMDKERLEKILRFVTHRSFQQGGLVYPRNFLEDECPAIVSER